MLRVPEVDDPDFVAEMSYAEGPVLKLTGSVDKTSTAAIGALFSALHDELGERGARTVVIDMHDLDYMAASCFRQLLAWVNQVQALDDDRRYAIRLRGNPSVAWQVHSLAALACFDTELIRVESAP